MDKEWRMNAKKDLQSITRDWNAASQTLISGIIVKEVKNVPKNNGYLTEIFRAEWLPENAKADQVFQVMINPGAISAWHTHESTVDRIFVNIGLMKIVLYDPRPDSPTFKQLNTFIFGTIRPALLIVPPKVWHGIQNITTEPSFILNIVDKAYTYESPDHWRLPSDTDQIPYKF